VYEHGCRILCPDHEGPTVSFYLVAGQGASTDSAPTGRHLPTTRPRCYPSDTSDVEWEVMAGYVPVGGASPTRGGRPVIYPRRDVVDAIRYLDHNGCQWRALPVDFPPRELVYHYFKTWNRDGTLSRMHNALRERVRTAEGRQADPSAGLVDSQSLRGAETVGRSSRGSGPGAVDRARSGFGPPLRARRCELSITALDQSSLSAECSSASSSSCSRCHTPASCHSARRRQQVMPDPNPSCWARNSHAIPVCSANRIPHSTLRSGSRLRPGIGTDAPPSAAAARCVPTTHPARSTAAARPSPPVKNLTIVYIGHKT